jgi:PAS domain S-box-containing protein
MNKNIYTDKNRELASERFELVAKATHDVIWDWDLIKNTVWWNEGITLIFGHSQEDLEDGPDSWYNRIHPDDQENVLKKIHRVLDNGISNWSDSYRFRRSDGSYAYVQDRGYTIHQDGMPVRMLGSMQDISEQVLLLEAQKESEERLAFALKSAQLGTWDMDPVHQMVSWDQRCRWLFGFEENKDINYQDVLLHIHPDDRKRVNTAVLQALNAKNDGVYNVQFRTIDAENNTLRWLHCKGQAYFGKDDIPYRFSGIAQDITDQILYREKAYFADQRATMTIEGTGAGSFLLDVSTNDIVYSPTLSVILTGEISTQLSRQVFIQHVHPEDRSIREQAFSQAAETGELNYEARFIWKDGSVHWVKVIAKYLYDHSGNGVSLSGIVIDITDRVSTEQKLRASEEHLRNMIEQAPVATALFVGKEMIIEIPNEAMLKIWGRGCSVIGMPLREALPELVGQPFLDILDEVYQSGESYHALGAEADLFVDGSLQTFYFDFTYKPLFNKDGEVYAILDMAVDVTSQVLSARALKKSESLHRQLADELEVRVQQRTNELHMANLELTNSNNSLQQFAYSASHDMQEPLRKIQSFASRLQNTYADKLDSNGVFMLNRMQDAAKRMSSMIDDLLAYSRLTTQEPDFAPIAINKVISEVISDLEIAIQEENAVITVEDMPTVMGRT